MRAGAVDQLGPELYQLGDLVDEPRVDTREPSHPLDTPPRAQGLLDPVDPAIGGHPHRIGQAPLVELRVGSGPESRVRCLGRPQRLAERFGEITPDGHDLADALHVRREHRISGRELLERESRHLDHDVVEAGLERSRRLAGDVVRDLVEGVTDRQLRRDLGDREAGRLGRERARSGHARVHLDHDHSTVGRIDRELDVAAAGIHADGPQHGDADISHVLEFAIGERHRRCDRDRVAGVHTHRIDVLDRADHDHVVVAVAHQLELELLPPEDRLFDQHLVDRACGQAAQHDRAHLVGVGCEAGAQSAHRVARPHDDPVADRRGELHRLVEGVANEGRRDLRPDAAHDVLEPLAILSPLDRLDVRPDQLDPISGQHSAAVQLDGQIQRGLAAQRRQ